MLPPPPTSAHNPERRKAPALRWVVIAVTVAVTSWVWSLRAMDRSEQQGQHHYL